MAYEKLECTRSNEESEAYWTDDVVLTELSLVTDYIKIREEIAS